MDFKNIDKKYRPIPFWSWNEKLDTEETKRQVALMDEAGIGGYFMHARGGLETEYMGKEWFDNVHAATDEGGRRGMYSWAYDENGWPSGFGGGKVNGLGVDYQQKSLHAKAACPGDEDLPETILVKDGVRYYYEVNPFYVDVLSKKVMRKFIDEIYVEYAKECGNEIEGFFTDEPQILRGTGYPWSFILEDEFTARYGYSLVDKVDRLFVELDDSARVRVDYWQLVTDMFSEAYFRQIGEWCEENGYKLTGHLVLEETVMSQLIANGACMPHYEYFSIPGMDWLGKGIDDFLTPMQLSSAAAQTGKKQILSETFGCAGHSVTHNELKRVYEWQMVHGVNLLCTHLEGYTLRGIRKRDYPPAMYYQQPWWDDMKIFFDAMSRIGMLLAEGEVCADTLLLHNQTTAWMLYDGIELSRDKIKVIEDLGWSLSRDMRTLEDKHILYHLGDETLIRRHGRVEGGKFIVGKMSYSTLVIPEHIAFLPYTDKLIAEFKAQGGRVITAAEAEANPVTGINRLGYTYRRHDGFDLHYFVNTDETPITAEITVGNKQLIPETGDTVPFFGTHTFAPFESLLLIDTHEGREEEPLKIATTPLSLSGEWQVKGATHNSLTLDRCDWEMDGEKMGENTYVLDILPRLNELRRPVKLTQTFRFNAEFVPDELYLATETPELFEIEVNGAPVVKNDAGYFRDSSIRMLPIGDYAVVGENTVTLRSTVSQSEACYRHLDSSWAFESMRNCLWYDTEIEPVYIVGDFGLRINGEPTELIRDAYRTYGAPTIVKAPDTVDIARLDLDGYSQFAGRLTLTKTVDVTDTHRTVHLEGRGMNSIHLTVNGKEVATKLYAPYDVDITDYLVEGENTLELTILNNLRNMMGPHHLKEGEGTFVCPGTFYRESNIFYPKPGADGSCHDVLGQWDDDYCFIHFGL